MKISKLNCSVNTCTKILEKDLRRCKVSLWGESAEVVLFSRAREYCGILLNKKLTLEKTPQSSFRISGTDL